MKKIFIGIFIISLTLILLCSCDSPEPPLPTTDTYEVVSVTTFVEVSTNGYGAVFNQWIAYNVNYIDANGNIKIAQINPDRNYNHTLALGTSNYLEITSDNYFTLYLTRDTYNKLTGGSEQ
jgi:hypothetical protein